VTLAAIAVLALSGAGVFVVRTAGLSSGTAKLQPPGGPFVLTATDGTTVTDRSLRGRWLLVYFGYTSCPAICPMTLSAITAALENLGPLAEKIQPVFITIDPERDTPERIDAFTKAFDSHIIGLTGKPAEIAEVAKEYRVFFHKLPAANPDDYVMEHSAYVFLIDPRGRYVTLFTPDQIEAPDDMAARIRELVRAST
jgi:protein SCO1